MKNVLPKIAMYTASVIISSLPFTIDLAEADDKMKTQAIPLVTNHHTPKSDDRRKILAQKSQEITNEAYDVLSGTEQALSALLKSDSKKAAQLLQSVAEKLDILSAKNPEAAFIPADFSVTVEEFEGDEQTVKKLLNTIDDLFEDGKIQAAKQLIDELVSEVDVTTTRIPLAIFTTGICNVQGLIADGKNAEAADSLYFILNSLENITEIIPLPLLRAEEFLTVASELEHKQNLSKSANREEIFNLVDAAKTQLKLAILLGYGNKEDYSQLYTAIDGIKAAVQTQASQAMWNNIKQSVGELKNKLVRSKNTN